MINSICHKPEVFLRDDRKEMEQWPDHLPPNNIESDGKTFKTQRQGSQNFTSNTSERHMGTNQETKLKLQYQKSNEVMYAMSAQDIESKTSNCQHQHFPKMSEVDDCIHSHVSDNFNLRQLLSSDRIAVESHFPVNLDHSQRMNFFEKYPRRMSCSSGDTPKSMSSNSLEAKCAEVRTGGQLCSVSQWTKSYDINMSTNHVNLFTSGPRGSYHDTKIAWQPVHPNSLDSTFDHSSRKQRQQSRPFDLDKILGNQDITYDTTRLWVNKNKISLSDCDKNYSKYDPALDQEHYFNPESSAPKGRMKNKPYSKLNGIFAEERQNKETLFCKKPLNMGFCSNQEQNQYGDQEYFDHLMESNSAGFNQPVMIRRKDKDNPNLSDEGHCIEDHCRTESNLMCDISEWCQKMPPKQVPMTAEWCQKMPPKEVPMTAEWCQKTPPKEVPLTVNYPHVISEIVDCLKYLHVNFDTLLINDSVVIDNMCDLGDLVVSNLVSWTRHLPFYNDISIDVHSQLLTEKWHKLLLLVTSAQHVVAGNQECFTFEEFHLKKLGNVKCCLNKLFKKNLGSDNVSSIMESFIKHICTIMFTFNSMGLKQEEYACLQAILLLNQEDESERRNEVVAKIHDRYLEALEWYISHHHGDSSSRLQNLLLQLPEIYKASDILLQTKMIYIPFFLNL